MTRKWTKCGTEFMEAEEIDVTGEMLDRMAWRRFSDTPSIGVMPGLFIGNAIRELRLPRASKFAIRALSSGHAIIGIECNWKDGRERRYFVDTGSEGIPIASDFHAGDPALPPYLDTNSLGTVFSERVTA